MAGAMAGGSVVCVLPLLSVRDLNQPGPTPPLARIFRIFWRTLRFSVALITGYSKLFLIIRSDAAVLKLHTIRPTLLPPLAVIF